ncbi:MAG: transglycosylase SLT domain-containing protein [Pseudomonadota bacterium]
MQSALKSIENNTLAALTQRAPQNIVNAIQTASKKTGVSFSYLMEKAAAESSFNPTVKAKTSSATGLFQFIESTWMDMVHKHGDKHGIDTNQSHEALLNLRKDPALASVMAAEFASDNKAYLKKAIGGDIGETELYFAHFMGAGGASAFLSQLKENPHARAADLFPREARANRNVFYGSQTGHEKTMQQVYARTRRTSRPIRRSRPARRRGCGCPPW